MSEGLVFTKSQALALFYQIGEVPTPTAAGDAIEWSYFHAYVATGEFGTNLSGEDIYGNNGYFSGDRIQIGASGERAGYLDLEQGGADKAAVIVMRSASAAYVKYINMDSTGNMRYGTTDPDGDPDVNPLMATGLGALLVDGSVFMTGPVEAQAGVVIRSRRNLLESYDDVDDAFDDNVLNTAIWNGPDHAYAEFSVEEIGGSLKMSYDDSEGTNSKADGITSKFRLQGNFDVRIKVTSYTGISLNRNFIAVGEPDSSWDQTSALVAELSTTFNGMAIMAMTDVGPEFRSVYRVSGEGAGTVLQDGTDPASGVLLRIARSGTTVTSYYRNPGDGSWTQMQSQAINSNEWQVYVGMHSANTEGDATTNWNNFDVTAGTIVKSVSDGPYVVVDGYGPQLPAGEDALLVYDQSMYSGDPVFRVQSGGETETM
jgi:hypothetical protein